MQKRFTGYTRSFRLMSIMCVFMLFCGLEAVFAETSVGKGMSGSIEMVTIPGGTFRRGSDNPDDYASPVHAVKISEFMMSRYEVTEAQYRATVGKKPVNAEEAGLPVVHVSWYDAVEFCNALSKKEGLDPVYSIDKKNADPGNSASDDAQKWTVVQDLSKNGYRLPTETEWEYAYRAGTATVYYWGDSINPDYLWFADNSDGTRHVGGGKKPNAWGLHDMSGNVWEWCWDWWTGYDDYTNGMSATDPVGYPAGENRMFRGGGIYSHDGDPIRAASHAYNAQPVFHSDDVGIRVVRRGK